MPAVVEEIVAANPDDNEGQGQAAEIVEEPKETSKEKEKRGKRGKRGKREEEKVLKAGSKSKKVAKVCYKTIYAIACLLYMFDGI